MIKSSLADPSNRYWREVSAALEATPFYFPCSDNKFANSCKNVTHYGAPAARRAITLQYELISSLCVMPMVAVSLTVTSTTGTATHPVDYLSNRSMDPTHLYEWQRFYSTPL